MGFKDHHTYHHQRQAVKIFHEKETTLKAMILLRSCQVWVNVPEGQRFKDLWFLNIGKVGIRFF